MADLPSHLDNIKQKKGLIDLSASLDGDFGLNDFTLSFVFDDIVLVEYIDEVSDGMGDAIKRGSVYIPVNASTKSWRKATVVLVGPNVQYCKRGDIVIFPNDKGVSVANIDIKGYGRLKKGMFLNEQRLFGKCEKDESQSTVS